MSDSPELLLDHHLKTLKLPTFLREYRKLSRQCAAEGLDHVRFLARLVELELIDRERRMIERRIKAAKFPAAKSLDSFDFKAIPALNKMQVLELARCEWVERRENVIALGPSGTGKTHVALGLGLAACQKGLTVGFTTAAALVHELMEARDERRLLRLQALTGRAVERVYVDKGYRGHDAPKPLRVFLSGQRRGVHGQIKRELRRRSAIEAAIGHMKTDGHLGRNFLKGRHGDQANAVLTAVGYNLRLILNWLRLLLRKILDALLVAFSPRPAGNPAS